MQEAFEAALRAANARYDAALIAGDAAALEAIYADDFRFISAQTQTRDKEQIRVMTQEADLLSAASDQIEVMALGSRHALVT